MGEPLLLVSSQGLEFVPHEHPTYLRTVDRLLSEPTWRPWSDRPARPYIQKRPELKVCSSFPLGPTRYVIIFLLSIAALNTPFDSGPGAFWLRQHLSGFWAMLPLWHLPGITGLPRQASSLEASLVVAIDSRLAKSCPGSIIEFQILDPYSTPKCSPEAREYRSYTMPVFFTARSISFEAPVELKCYCTS